ncbi:MAG: hypothetical protein V4690_02880 [Patescibacteria group bacterium]
MDETTLKNMPDYLQKLPKPVQDFIFEGSWRERTESIAKKYSLNPTQTETLADNVLFVLIGIDEGENFIKLMPSELGISKLLSEQIVEDLEIRVFEYAVKSVERKTSKTETPTPQESEDSKPSPLLKTEQVSPVAERPDIAQTNTPKPTTQLQQQKPPLHTQITKPVTSIPEIRPNIMPMVEKGESVKILEPKVSVAPKHHAPRFVPQKTTPPVFVEKNMVSASSKILQEAPKTSENRIHYKPKDFIEEKVEQPVPVPRFTAPKDIDDEVIPAAGPEAVPLPKTTPDLVAKNTTTPPIQTKSIENPAIIQKQVAETVKPTHSYAVDPYREPLE